MGRAASVINKPPVVKAGRAMSRSCSQVIIDVSAFYGILIENSPLVYGGGAASVAEHLSQSLAILLLYSMSRSKMLYAARHVVELYGGKVIDEEVPKYSIICNVGWWDLLV